MIETHLKPTLPLSRTRLAMVEACGRISQVLGIARSVGQIYGLLYLAPEPLSLDAIAELLGISKGSASTGTRQLAAWGAIRQVWIPGDRRDHFQAEPDLGRLLQAGYVELLKPRLVASQKRLEKIARTLNEDLHQGAISPQEHKLYVERLRNFQQLQEKLESLIPLAEKLF